MRRWHKRVLIGFGVLVILAVAGASFLLFGSLPKTSGEWVVPGIEGEVEIGRDEHGIPLIRASSLDDLYFGIGFAHAQDRLWQMDFSRRVGQGRLSEVLGADALPIDRFMRVLGIYRVSDANYENLSEPAKRHLDAYARGVNAFIESNSWPLPPEFLLLRTSPEPWRPADSIVMSKLLALDLSKNRREEIARTAVAAKHGLEILLDLWPGPPPGSPATLAVVDAEIDRLVAMLGMIEEPDVAGLGSNIWAVDAKTSASGGAILANDPHLRLRAPSVWYLARFDAPEVQAVGGTIPSLPAIVIGRNQDLAWGFTNSGADAQDLFIETIDEDDATRYLAPEGSLAFEIQVEQIEIAGAEPEEIVVRRTRHGPVISDVVTSLQDDDGSRVVALAWTALLESDRTVEAGLDLAAAVDANELEAAVRKFDSPPQNVMYAERGGDIGFMLTGLIPKRRAGDGWMPVAGALGEFDWDGFLPFEDKPAARNPSRGWMANANNRVVDASFPAFLSRDWDPPLRAERIESQLAAAPHDANRAMALQNDVHSGLARHFLPMLEPLRGKDEVADALLAWDQQVLVDRPEPLIFATWYRAWLAGVLGDDLGPELDWVRGRRSDSLRWILSNAANRCDDKTTVDIAETCEDIAARALDDAMQSLIAQYGDDWRSWRWGDAAPVIMAHQPFSNVPWLRRFFEIRTEKGGDPSSPNVASHATSDPFATIAAASMRMLVDWASPDEAAFTNASGQSGHPLSRHWDDLTSLWRDGRYLSLVVPGTQPAGHRANRAEATLLLTPES